MYSSAVIDHYRRITEPTPEGRKRYAAAIPGEPSGYYLGDPCVCDSRCAVDCQGECGCEACRCAGLDAKPSNQRP